MIVTLSGGLNATTAPVDWDAEFGTGLPHVAAYVDAEPSVGDDQ